MNAAYAAATVRSPLPSGRDTHRGLAGYNADMAALAEERPDVARTVVAGKVERWTLTYEKNGTVLRRTTAQVDRGGTATADLTRCRRRW